MGEELVFEDYWRVRRLKYLRLRSLSNPRYRDSAFLRNFLRRRGVNGWTGVEPLESFRRAVEKRLDEYDRAAKRKQGSEEDALWHNVLVAVDALIEVGDQLNGSTIQPGAW